MNVRDIMCPQVHTCHASDAVDSAARIMWDHDCGSVPVVDEERRVIGVITDRDICMAAYIQGLPLREIAVRSAMSREVHACSVIDDLDAATELMRQHRIRRVPVVDDGGRIVGVVSLTDIALAALDSLAEDSAPVGADDVVRLLGSVCEPRFPRDELRASRGAPEPRASSARGAPSAPPRGNGRPSGASGANGGTGAAPDAKHGPSGAPAPARDRPPQGRKPR